MEILNAALACHRAGLAVWPALPEQKRPAGHWGGKDAPRLDEDRLAALCRAARGLCILCGAASGGVECIDFDDKGSAFLAWREAVRAAYPDLLARLVMERSPSGGVHVVYRCPEAERPKTRKLAFAPGDGRLLVETRGDGAVFLCDPTPGYQLFQGSFTDVPAITIAERNALLAFAAAQGEPMPCAIRHAPCATAPAEMVVAQSASRTAHGGSLHSYVAKALAEEAAEVASCPEGGRNHRLNKAAFKLGHYVAGGVLSEELARSELTRAALASGLETHETAMSIASGLAAGMRDPKGVPDPSPDAPDGYGVNLDALVAQARRTTRGPMVEVVEAEREDDPPEVAATDPGHLPDAFYRLPGFVSDVMDFTLDCAPSPNPILSFCGAVALQAHLAGRKIRDDNDIRPNLYLIALANPSSGKDYPRKFNFRLLDEIGVGDTAGQGFASGEGLQDSLLDHPAMLYQTDEIANYFMALARSKDGRAENALTELLAIFTSSDGKYVIRKKAKSGSGGGDRCVIQPSLTILGTAPVKDFYEALTPRILTNGLFARLTIVEAERPVVPHDAKIADIPPAILSAARWWAELVPAGMEGNLARLPEAYPRQLTLGHTPEAREIFAAFRDETIARRNAASAANDTLLASIWGRGREIARKFALLHAASLKRPPEAIGREAAEWAVTFARHQIERAVYMAGLHVAENETHAAKQRIIRLLRDEPDGALTRNRLTRKTQWLRPRDRDEILADLLAGGEMEKVTESSGGRLRELFRLRGKTAARP